MTDDWRYKIQAAARELLGTPFHHQGRLRGVGIDCVGVLVYIATRLGIPHEDSTCYNRHPDGTTLQREIEKSMAPIPVEEAGIGDALVFRMFRHPCHVGIKTDRGVLHTYDSLNRVVEHSLTGPWLRRVCGAYRFKGLV